MCGGLLSFWPLRTSVLVRVRVRVCVDSEKCSERAHEHDFSVELMIFQLRNNRERAEHFASALPHACSSATVSLQARI